MNWKYEILSIGNMKFFIRLIYGFFVWSIISPLIEIREENINYMDNAT